MRPSGKGLYAAGWINAVGSEPHPQYTSSWCDAVTFLFYQSWDDNLLRVLHWVEGCLGALCIILQLCNSKSGDSAHRLPPEKVAVCMQCGWILKLATALLSLKYTHFFSLLKIPLTLCCFGFRLWFCVKISYQPSQVQSLQNTLITPYPFDLHNSPVG